MKSQTLLDLLDEMGIELVAAPVVRGQREIADQAADPLAGLVPQIGEQPPREGEATAILEQGDAHDSSPQPAAKTVPLQTEALAPWDLADAQRDMHQLRDAESPEQAEERRFAADQDVAVRVEVPQLDAAPGGETEPTHQGLHAMKIDDPLANLVVLAAPTLVVEAFLTPNLAANQEPTAPAETFEGAQEVEDRSEVARPVVAHRLGVESPVPVRRIGPVEVLRMQNEALDPSDKPGVRIGFNVAQQRASYHYRVIRRL